MPISCEMIIGIKVFDLVCLSVNTFHCFGNECQLAWSSYLSAKKHHLVSIYSSHFQHQYYSEKHLYINREGMYKLSRTVEQNMLVTHKCINAILLIPPIEYFAAYSWVPTCIYHWKGQCWGVWGHSPRRRGVWGVLSSETWKTVKSALQRTLGVRRGRDGCKYLFPRILHLSRPFRAPVHFWTFRSPNITPTGYWQQ